MARRRRSILVLCLLTSCIVPTISASGSETVSYAYDARGRLLKVTRSGTVNNGVSACYAYDKADNRSNVTVAVTGDCSGSPPSFSINDVSVSEGGNLVLTVSKSGSTSSSFSVNYATADGSATGGADYTSTSGSLTFAAAESTKTLAIGTSDDAMVESAETVLVNLSGATGGATISDGQGVGTINDNDVAPTCGGASFTIASNGAVTEGVNSVFTITKSGSTSNSCSVGYATANGTATSGADYTAASGTLTFTSAQTSLTVSVATTDDATVESAETFSMSLSSPSGGSTLGMPSSATATLNDNDSGGGSPPSFSINDASGTEGTGATITFTVTKTGATSGSYAVNYATANGTATSAADYFVTSGTLTFAAGESSKTIVVTLRNGFLVENDEIFYVNLTASGDGSTVADAQGVGAIWDDDGGGIGPCYDANGGRIPCP